jgi:hypothetical protein
LRNPTGKKVQMESSIFFFGFSGYLIVSLAVADLIVGEYKLGDRRKEQKPIWAN